MIKSIFQVTFSWTFSFAIACFGFAQAQESTNASGGDATGSGGTVAYSVGQLVYTSHTGSAGTVDQGVQHAFEIFNLGIVDPALNSSITAYPNPTVNRLTLEISNYTNQKLSYKLYDILGKLINNGQIIAQQTQIEMNSLASATYFINVVNQKNKTVKFFKIIKN